MMNRLLLFAFMLPFSVFGQTSKADSTAVLILDRMADIIGELNSCSFNLNVSLDKQGTYGLEKEFSAHEVLLQGPDKMMVSSKGDDFHKAMWYNGEHMVYYSYRENNFSVMEAPNTILKAIDSVNTEYGIEFPAADFFYPTFTDDMLNDFTILAFLGSKEVNGRDCFHILAENSSQSVQIWISDDALALPVRYTIRYKDKEGQPQYDAVFTNWQVNPVLPDTLFEFTPPPQSRQIAIVSKTMNP